MQTIRATDVLPADARDALGNSAERIADHSLHEAVDHLADLGHRVHDRALESAERVPRRWLPTRRPLVLAGLGVLAAALTFVARRARHKSPSTAQELADELMDARKAAEHLALPEDHIAVLVTEGVLAPCGDGDVFHFADVEAVRLQRA